MAKTIQSKITFITEKKVGSKGARGDQGGSIAGTVVPRSKWGGSARAVAANA